MPRRAPQRPRLRDQQDPTPVQSPPGLIGSSRTTRLQKLETPPVTGGVFLFDVGIEPTFPDAALCTDVRSFGSGQKRDKTKGSFAKGLWHKIFQRFRRVNLIVMWRYFLIANWRLAAV